MTEMTTKRLSENLYKLKDLNYTIEYAEEILWEDIDLIRKDLSIIDHWEYKDDLLLIEKDHENERIPYGKNLNWKQSYVLGLLLCIWH